MYITNKTKAEKKYEEQQQSLKFDELKYNQLISAIKENKAEEVENLIKELNSKTLSKIDNNGETALTWAASKGLEKVCEMLISKMSDQAINHVTKTYGETALTLAAGYGLKKVCEMLIPIMTEQAINQVNSGGSTALTLAAFKGLEKVCEMLISKMSNEAINHVTNYGIRL
ncbi:ankyrin repeat domain-containing protein [Rickettsia endosymbiont of Orchestes rusci]|uniref:ankyrin repeat domain-containing protein n=1 Tax=Rickettsia endosymbiont of Orchestes rusci TaxID=3066250 RepID=UPI00313D957F